MSSLGRRAALYDTVPEEQRHRWDHFGHWEAPMFPSLVGLQLEEVRMDYSRMRLPYRPDLNQPAGMVHGGAIATLVDTVVVPAIASAYDAVPTMLTIDMQLRYLGAAQQTDLVGEGWIVKRGRSIVFCQAEIVGAPEGELVAEGWLTYRVFPTSTRQQQVTP